MPAGFTIAIPTHNRRETVLLAVRSAIAQTRAPEQVIVLCDGCSDGTAEALRALGDERVQPVELPKLPGFGYDHRNRSLELASGEAIMWLGDDDLLLPDHLERIGEYWDTGVFDVVQTPAVVVWSDDSLTWVGLDWSVPGHASTLLDRNTNVMSSVLVRVDSARAAGGWEGSLARFGDWDLWKRLLAGSARTGMTQEPTVLHFRATGRDQPWPERVAQNSRWLERISDRDALVALRRELRSRRSQREAEWMGEIDALTSQLAQAQAEAQRLGEAEQTLQRIYGGGWWRLRARLLPAIKLARRLRG